MERTSRRGALRAGAPLLTTMLSLLPFAAGGETPPVPLALAWCLERAHTANPRLAVDAAAASAARERIKPAGALDDPRFSYEASNLPVGAFDFSSTPLSGNQLGLRQRLPFPGLLSNRANAARAGAEAASLEFDDRRLTTDGAVEAAWAELGFAQRALGVTDRNIELLRQLNAVAEAKYRVGTGIQQDVLRAQVELTALLQQRLAREAAIETTSARLAALLDLGSEPSFPETGPLEDTAPLAGLGERSPRLRALAARVEAARRALRVAELEGYPDFDLGFGYRIRQRVEGDPVAGDDFISAGIAVRLPVDRGKWRAHAAERRALLRREEALERAARADLEAGIRSAFAELQRADAETRLLETGLIPQAAQSLESSRSGYEVGRIDFLSLLDSQLRLLDAELRRLRSLADRRIAFATLEAASGEKLR